MGFRRWIVVLLLTAAAVFGLFAAPGCGDVRSAGEDTEPIEEAALAAGGPSASDVAVSLATRAIPGGSTVITVTASLSGVQSTSAVKLRFTGDASKWPNADVPAVSKSGKVFTFTRTLQVSDRVGLHELSWAFEIVSTGAHFGPVVKRNLEATCSDGVFCNGEERFTKLGCAAGPPPCDDDEPCTIDTCDEAAGTCHFEPNGAGCKTCAAKNCNPKCGPQTECGDDGCGGKCVTPQTDASGKCLNDEFCVEGICQAISLPGTCANPLPLFGAAGTLVPSAGILTTVLGNTSTGIDALKVSCGGEGIKELVYQFDVPVKMGLEIRMLSASGDPGALDTVLAVHHADCLTQGPFGGFCSDDASPPGELGSRVYGPVDPGSYRLIATGYSAAQVGPFQLQIKFVPGCVPQCDGKFCGSDGCGGACGACDAGQQCSALGRCFTAPCTPDCSGGRKCGDDGCGGTCGTCPAGDLCAEIEGKCVPSSGCDHLLPTCKSCGPLAYCGTDCACHPVTETLVDLVPAPASTLIPSIEFEWRTFDGSSCAIAEECVPGPGRWLLMRFATDVLNQGLAGFKPGDPTQLPELFEYHGCHQHYHFSGFASFGLFSWDGDSLLQGRKLSYCMEDSYQHLLGPSIPCEGASTCDDQGIQPGWADSYPAALDCQWLVLRGETASAADIPANQWYVHETCTNVGRAFHEHSFDNNCLKVPVYIPDVPDNGQVVKYSDLTLPPMPNP